jgi:hypothetical protein
MEMKRMRWNMGDPDRSSIIEYLLTSRKGKELCRGLRRHFPVLVLVRNGYRIDSAIKKYRRVLLLNSSGEPEEGKLQVQFCERRRCNRAWHTHI